MSEDDDTLKGALAFALASAVALLLAGTAAAAGLEAVTVTRTGPPSVSVGSEIDVTIVVENNVNQHFSVVVEEHFAGGYVSSDGELVQQRIPLYRPDFIRWSFILPPGWRKEFHYVTKAEFPGKMISIPTAVYLENGSEDFYFESGYLEVEVLCNGNGRCETDEGEDYLTCPDDCGTGIKDDNCDLLEDERCDPDCMDGYDPDCQSTGAVTGDGFPESLKLAAVAVVALAVLFVALLFFMVRRRQSALKSPAPMIIQVFIWARLP